MFGINELAFGALATAGGKLAPTLDTATNRCGNLYCHGATLSGGMNVTPEWTKVGQGEAVCGTCHGVPPPAPHKPPQPNRPVGATRWMRASIAMTSRVATTRLRDEVIEIKFIAGNAAFVPAR